MVHLDSYPSTYVPETVDSLRVLVDDNQTLGFVSQATAFSHQRRRAIIL